MIDIENITMGIYEMLSRPMPIFIMLAGFGALRLIVEIEKRKDKIKEAFEVKPLTAEEAKQASEEMKLGQHYSI